MRCPGLPRGPERGTHPPDAHTVERPVSRLRRQPNPGPLILGLAAVLLVLAGVGAIVGLALADNDTNAPRASANEPAPANDPEPTVREQEEASRPEGAEDLDIGDSVEAGAWWPP